MALAGKDTSIWLDTTQETNYPAWQKDKRQLDVVVAGGGMSGILTAWLMEKEGLTTAVIEKDRIVKNTTGNTTAKLTSQHNLIYDDLIRKHGISTARAYAIANQQAIDDIEAVVRQLEIECDFSHRDAYVFTVDKEKLDDINAEVAAAKKLNLPATFVEHLDLPFKITGAIKFAQQAQFHPRKFLLAVAANYIQEGGTIYEQTEVIDIKLGNPNVLKTKKGDIKANFIVGATKYPFWRTKLFEKKTWTKLSYALGVKLKAEKQYPKGMYINAERPVRTIRSHPYDNGQILIFGGESHEMTKNYEKNEHYQILIDDVKKRFAVDKILYRWIAGDVMPYDRIPYIGAYPGQKDIFIITGFQAWGLCWAIVAAQLITDLITGRPNPLQDILSPERPNRK